MQFRTHPWHDTDLRRAPGEDDGEEVDEELDGDEPDDEDDDDDDEEFDDAEFDDRRFGKHPRRVRQLREMVDLVTAAGFEIVEQARFKATAFWGMMRIVACK